MLSAKGRVQGQPAVIRARHIFWGVPLCSHQPLPHCAVSPGSLHGPGCHITRGAWQLFLAASLLKGHFAPVFLSVVLAPQAVGVLTFTLISKQGDSSGNTGLLVSTANVYLCHVKEDAGKIVKCQQSKFGNSILHWKLQGRSGFRILCTGKGIPS